MGFVPGGRLRLQGAGLHVEDSGLGFKCLGFSLVTMGFGCSGIRVVLSCRSGVKN